MGAFCDENCRNKKQSYTYNGRVLNGWTAKCTCCRKRHSWSDGGMRDHILFYFKKSPYKLDKNRWNHKKYFEYFKSSILKEYIYIVHVPKCEICKKTMCSKTLASAPHPEERCNTCRKVFSRLSISSLKIHIKRSKKCKRAPPPGEQKS